MNIGRDSLLRLAREYGDAFYLLDSARFARNFDDLLAAFRAVYPASFIAYSYKTNYIPALCRLVKAKGGFAEVVSGMEYELAERLGVPPGDIYCNGPYKPEPFLRRALTAGAKVNLDSLAELDCAARLAREGQARHIALGLRCNFDIGAGISRFGLDVEGAEFAEALRRVAAEPNLRLAGLHCHFPTRCLESFAARAEGMKKVVERLDGAGASLDYIAFGGGWFGRMPPEFATRLGVEIPSFEDYAAVIAGAMRGLFPVDGPRLILEPGSALVADAMSLVAKVVSVKSVRGRYIATLAASSYDVNPSAKGVRRPLQVFHAGENASGGATREWDLAGYTCIEDDLLYAGYEGPLAVGDFVLFRNVGSYSVVFKPPFILPGLAVIDTMEEKPVVVKRAETLDDVFAAYDPE